MYRPEGLWVWDFWLTRDNATWHMFHLQAPADVHPDERHWHASIGHAASEDLTNWTTLGTALEPGPNGAWDALTLWTGSVLRHRNGRWLMAYTGLRRERDVPVERIGLAWSDDLLKWEKDPANPIVESDPRWYEEPGCTNWAHGWRDPYLVETSEGYAMLISARTRSGDPYRRGSIALASSPDAHSWTVHEPVEGTTGLVAQLEVPHLVDVGGDTLLVVSTDTDGPWPRNEPGHDRAVGTATIRGRGSTGPFDGSLDLLDVNAGRYAGRLIEDGGRLRYLAFDDAPSGAFRGGVTQPIDVSLGADGRLELQPSTTQSSTA